MHACIQRKHEHVVRGEEERKKERIWHESDNEVVAIAIESDARKKEEKVEKGMDN